MRNGCWSIDEAMPSVAVTDRREDVMKAVLGLAMIAAGAVATPVKAADEAIKIGVLTDLSGLYAAPTGPGSVFAARLAVADFVAAHKGLKVEVVAGDHQNKTRTRCFWPPAPRPPT